MPRLVTQLCVADRLSGRAVRSTSMIALATLIVMLVSLGLLVAAIVAINHLEQKNPPQLPPDWDNGEK